MKNTINYFTIQRCVERFSAQLTAQASEANRVLKKLKSGNSC